jgi:hypothetical protein
MAYKKGKGFCSAQCMCNPLNLPEYGPDSPTYIRAKCDGPEMYPAVCAKYGTVS